MWNINPEKMCRKHLLGEHVELHMFVGSMNKGRSLKGHLDKGQLEIHNIRRRHIELVKEMQARGYKHKSKLPKFKSRKAGTIDSIKNYEELIKRCKECRERNKINRNI